MPIRPILRHPDPLLRRKAEPVSDFGPGLAALATDLTETMIEAGGVGITAPHVGVSSRLVVLKLGDGPVEVFVNPEITETSDETVTRDEGSVSMPGVIDAVTRPARIRLSWQDLDGTRHEAEAEGWRATCLLHEIDQLDGIFWLQRLSRLRRDKVVRRFEKIRRLGGEA
ncbi:MAG: peptide deformylase [Zavarzinia sp.]|nr:peptide deformylase [Zavarzinia sp.]